MPLLCSQAQYLLTLTSHLHPGNMLLAARKLRATGNFTEEPEMSIHQCDFDLGRNVTGASPEAFSNQGVATRYRAPELALHYASYTTATDFHAAHVFIFDVLAPKAMSSSEPEPVLVPRKLWELCERCIARNPNERHEAIKVVFTLEQLKGR